MIFNKNNFLPRFAIGIKNALNLFVHNKFNKRLSYLEHIVKLLSDKFAANYDNIIQSLYF